jgi:hypothetical protein
MVKMAFAPRKTGVFGEKHPFWADFGLWETIFAGWEMKTRA